MRTKPVYHEWEVIALTDGESTETARMRVPGGWLYRHSYLSTSAIPDTMCFVPYFDERMEAQRDFAIEHTQKMMDQATAKESGNAGQ